MKQTMKNNKSKKTKNFQQQVTLNIIQPHVGRHL